MMNTPEPKLALVTGAAAGIGAATALRLSQAGITCILIDRAEEVSRVAVDVAARTGSATHSFVCDLAVEAQILALVQNIESRLGTIDILVNNAGVHPRHAGNKYAIEEIETTQWNEVFAINIGAPFQLSKAVLAGMRRRRWGRIINMASSAGRTASTMVSAHYAASKAALIGFTRTLALEGAPHGITANCVAPGPIQTQMSGTSAANNIAEFVAAIPMKRYGDPSEVAGAVAFLASDEASFITGSILDVAGGRFMP